MTATARSTAYERACERGSAEGCLRRGLAADPDDRARIQQACDMGLPLACSHLGDALRLGTGGPPDYPGALAAYDRACEAQDQSACHNAGRMRHFWLGTSGGAR